MRRPQLVREIERLVGTDSLRVSDVRDGWPALGLLNLDGQWAPVELYVGMIGRTHRDRDEEERRFQNPAKKTPINPDPAPGVQQLLLGLWLDDALADVQQPVLVSADPVHRRGLATRQSVFVGMDALLVATHAGWATYQNAAGESLVCFHPPLLGVAAHQQRLGIVLPDDQVSSVIDASGLLDFDEGSAQDRARRATTQLVRRSGFGRKVVEAYRGLCAMCGLGLGLNQGAHIYPASAPGAPDETWNGVSLCGNHHSAFDKHIIFVEPRTRRILFHPVVEAERRRFEACDSFVASTFQTLRDPASPADRPLSEMFERRYGFFRESYDWA